MPDIKFATADVSAMKLGTTNVSKVMFGTTEVWPGIVACTDVLAEPFDDYTTNGWTVLATSTIVAGRHGSAHQVSSSGGAATYAIPAPDQSTTLTTGFALRWTDAATGTRDICQLRAVSGGTIENKLVLVTSTGQLQFLRGTSTILASSATGVLAANTWYYLELKAFLHTSAGTVVVRVNGTEVINATALNTGNDPVYDAIRLNTGLSSTSQSWDDLYISTGAGCTFKGDITVPSLPGTDVLLEDFENLTDAPWTSSGAPTIVAGRTGNAARLSGTTSDAISYTIPAPSESDTLTVGFAYRTSTIGTLNQVLYLRSDAGVTIHNRLQILTTGALNYQRNITSLTGGASAAGIIAANTWYYIEVRAKLGDSPIGNVTVRVDGVEVINAFGLDTKNSGTKTVYDRVTLGSSGAGVIALHDDLYLTTGPGGGFKGDITIP